MSQRLQSGDKALPFTAQTWDGKTIRLDAFRGQKVWLSFYRYASCPLCNLRVHHIIKNYEKYQNAGLKILAIFQSPKESIEQYVGQQKPPFDLITDPEEKLYELYKLESGALAMAHLKNGIEAMKAFQLGFGPGKIEGTFTRIPADFLIDENGIIQKVFYGDLVSDHIPLDWVEQFMALKA